MRPQLKPTTELLEGDHHHGGLVRARDHERVVRT
jgi:hypothetical protein